MRGLFETHVRNVRGHAEFEFRASITFTPDFQFRVHCTRPLMHALDTPMPRPAALREDLLIYTNAVVSYAQTQHSGTITEIQFDVCRARVPKRVRDCLA